MKRTVRRLIEIFVLGCLVLSPAWGGNRLTVPFVGNWNFDVESAVVDPALVEAGQTASMAVSARCLESSDGTGLVRVEIRVQKDWSEVYSEIRDLNVVPAGRSIRTRFHLPPLEPGRYRIETRLLGGAGFLWLFDTATSEFEVGGTFDTREIPPGLRLLPLETKGASLVFTFSLGRGAVHRVANDYLIAEQYMRYVTWRMAERCLGDLGQGTLIGLAGTMAYRSQQLHLEASRLRGGSMIVQFECNPSVGHAASLLDKVASALSTMKSGASFGALVHPPPIP